jgi:diguanylate cyclase (GGDEF)-like protein
LALRELVRSTDRSLSPVRRNALVVVWLARWFGFTIPVLGLSLHWLIPNNPWPRAILLANAASIVLMLPFVHWVRTRPNAPVDRQLIVLTVSAACIGAELALFVRPALQSAQPERNVALCLVAVAVSSAIGAMSTAMVPQAFHAFNATMLLLVIAQLAITGVAYNIALAAGTAVVLATMTHTAIHVQRMLHTAIEGRIAQAELSSALTDAMVRLEVQAGTDELTGLSNRRRFMELLERRLQLKSANSASARLLFDVDNFKAVNDTFGHHIGDEVLRQVGLCVMAAVRRSDLVGRIGGEEFAALCTAKHVSIATTVAERIRVALNDIRIDDAPDLRVSASFGVAMIDNFSDVSEAMQAADVAQYRAKALGRNRVVVAEGVDVTA